MNLSDLLGKPLISLYEGRLEGVIKNAVFEKPLKKALWLILFDERDETCEEKALAPADVYSIGENAVMIKSGRALKDARTIDFSENNPINRPIYTAGGKLLGTVEDVIFGPKYTAEALIYASGQQMLVKDVLTAGADIVAIGDGEPDRKTVKPFRPAANRTPKPKPKDKARVVKTLNEQTEAQQPQLPELYVYDPEPAIGIATPFKNPVAEKPQASEEKQPDPAPTAEPLKMIAAERVTVDQTANGEANETIRETPYTAPKTETAQFRIVPVPADYDKTAIEKTETEDSADTEARVIIDDGKNIEVWPHETDHIPERIVAGYGFLLGRRVTRTIHNGRDEEIIRANQTIRARTVETARKFGRLVELTKYSE
ncbi:hypothetical protein FACS1894211_16530 [Clostridia bacterium]|nr:hypothetical protein FACS1894211_16530 [Clostridia bacterium]